MRRFVMVWVTAGLLAGGCTKKKDTRPTRGPDTTRAVTAELWSFAPANAAVGVVVGDGFGVELWTLAESVHTTLAASETGRQMIESAKAEMAKEGAPPFDPFSKEGWRSIGVDLARGAAVFLAPDQDGKETGLMVLPVVDRAAFRRATEAKPETIEGREVDRLDDDLYCGDVRGRYVCSSSMAILQAAEQPNTAGLAAVVGKLDGQLRGDLELYVDLTKLPDARPPAEVEQELGRIDTVVGAANLRPGGLTMRIQARGAMEGTWGRTLRGAKPPAALADAYAGATAVTRLRIDPAPMLAQLPPSIPAMGMDLRKGLLDHLTGDLQFVSGPEGLAFALLVTDDAPVRDTVKKLCDLLPGLVATTGMASAKPTDGGCTVELQRGGLPPQFAQAPDTRGSLALSGKRLRLLVQLGPPRPALDRVLTGSPEADEVLLGTQTLASWGTAFEYGEMFRPGSLLEGLASMPEAAESLAQARPMLDLWDRFMTRIYEQAIAFNVSATSMDMRYQVTTYGDDPPEVRAKYEAALTQRFAGDWAGHDTSMAALAKQHPDTLAGRRASMLGQTSFPVMTGVAAAVAIPAFMKYIRKSKTAEAVANLHAISLGVKAHVVEHGKLPSSAPMTPALGTCCQEPGGKCAANPARWQAAAWQAVGFSVQDPHYYAYTLEVSGGAFTVRALGDLDCDGEYSTFEVAGVVEDGQVQGSDAVYRDRDLE